MRVVECKQKILWEGGTQKQRVTGQKSKCATQTPHLTNSLKTRMKEL